MSSETPSGEIPKDLFFISRSGLVLVLGAGGVVHGEAQNSPRLLRVCKQSRTGRDLVECAVISMVAKVKREYESDGSGFILVHALS